MSIIPVPLQPKTASITHQAKINHSRFFKLLNIFRYLFPVRLVIRLIVPLDLSVASDSPNLFSSENTTLGVLQQGQNQHC